MDTSETQLVYHKAQATHWSYLHTRDEWREAEGALAQEGVHVDPQLLLDPRTFFSWFDILHFSHDAGEQAAEQLLG